MNLIDQLERRFRGRGIPYLIETILGGQLLAGIIALFLNKNILNILPLYRPYLLHGQLWRLVTFLFYPNWVFGGFFSVLSLLFYWWAGSALLRLWGDFRLTAYIALGVIGAWVGCLIGGTATADGILLSLFFAYAWLWPEQTVLLLGIVPLKVKWLGWLELAFWGATFLFGSIPTKICLLLELLGFLVFFGRDLMDWAQRNLR